MRVVHTLMLISNITPLHCLSLFSTLVKFRRTAVSNLPCLRQTEFSDDRPLGKFVTIMAGNRRGALFLHASDKKEAMRDSQQPSRLNLKANKSSQNSEVMRRAQSTNPPPKNSSDEFAVVSVFCTDCVYLLVSPPFK